MAKRKIYPEHRVEGQEYKNNRLAAAITRKYMAELCQCSESTIYNFEKGCKIKRRPLLLAAYGNGLKLTSLMRAVETGVFYKKYYFNAVDLSDEKE